MASLFRYTKHSRKKKIIVNLCKSFQRQGKKNYSNSFQEISITLITKPDKECTRKEN